MSIKGQLSFPSDVLALPKAVLSFSPRGLVFADDATDAQILAVGHRLLAAKGYISWALGSLFAEMLKRRPSKAGSLTDRDMGWVSEFCDAHRLDAKLRRELIGVYLFYQAAPVDSPSLDYEYYRECYFGTWGMETGGRLSKALGYLHRALDEGLSVTALRMLIRAEGRTTTPPAEDELNLAAYSAVFDFMRFAKHELPSVASYTPERARLILDDLGSDTIAYIDAVRSIAARDRGAA